MNTYIKTQDPFKCYGCHSCENICPKHAIQMKPNEEGFLYPVISEEKCVRCGLCVKACPYDSPSTTNTPIRTVAGQYKNRDALLSSSSGGLFSALADYILSKDGYVSGCIFDDSFCAIHILTKHHASVEKMRGSKYVQSTMGDVYKQIQQVLLEGSLVLFTGTPCQVDGLKTFLRKEYDNLYTVDLICHGVPSPKILEDYLDTVQRKKGEITELTFRNKKRNGWCSQGSIGCSGKVKTITPYNNSYYYYYYLENRISRYCCYECKYSNVNRVGDITIGDYWNIGDVLPNINATDGYSAVLINTAKGDELFNGISGNLSVYETTLENVVKGNGNLSNPCSMPENRKDIYSKISQNGYEETAKKECKYQYIKPFIRKHMPKGFKKIIKKILH